MAVYTTLQLMILYIYQLSLHHCTTITCSNQNCTNQDITCTPNTDCTINCISEKSCAFSRIYAETTSTLTINCIGNSSCLAIHIYCPTSTNNTKKCFLRENDNLSTNIHIYAINGWKDIDIQHSTSLTQSPGSMHCGYNYTSQCTIQTDWTCNNNQCSNSPENKPHSPDNFIIIYIIIIGFVVGLPIVVFCGYAIIKMCINAVKKNSKQNAENQRDNTKAQQHNSEHNFRAVPPASQIADTGKLQIPTDTELDMTVTIDTTHKQAAVTDPTQKFSRYSSVVYTGSPLANNNEPKSAVEVEIDTGRYMEQLSGAAEQIQSERNNGKNKPKKRFQNRKRFSAKVNKLPTNDQLTTPLTPERAAIVTEEQIEIDLDAYDLDEIDENKVNDSPYAQAARSSKLNMARTSSLRNLDKKDVDKFQALAVYNESLIEDVVMSNDIMTPNSPFTPFNE